MNKNPTASSASSNPAPGAQMPARSAFCRSLLVQGVILAMPAFALAAPPANDHFASRQVLASAASVNVNGTTGEATQEPLEPIYRSEGASVWYEWTAPSTGGFKLEATAAVGDDPPLVGVLQGTSLDTLELLAPDGVLSLAYFSATSGQKYYFHVAAGNYLTAGPFNLKLSASAAPAVPANDSFSAATVISGALPRSVNGSLAAATMESREPRPDIGDESSVQRSVWYSWTPSTAGWTAVQVDGLQSVNIYTGSSVTALAEIARADYWGESRFQAAAGTTYRIQVQTTWSDGAVPFTLTVMRPTDPQPAGDNFASAISLGNSNSITRSDSTAGARVETGEKLPQDVRSTVWYTWTAPATGVYAVEVTSPDFYPVAHLYSGATLPSLSLLAGSRYQDETDSDLLVFKATAGQVCRFQIGDPGEWGDWDFDFALRVATATDVAHHTLMTSFSATPATVNLTSAGGSFSAEAKTSTDAAPSLYLVAFSVPPWRQQGSGSPSRDLWDTSADLAYVDELITGNLTEYRHAETVELPGSLPAGDYGVYFYGGSGAANFGPYSGNPLAPVYPGSWSHAVPGGGRITVTNSNVDALPVLTQFTVSPTSVDVTSAARTLNLSAQATDDHGVADGGVNVAVHDSTSRMGGFMNMGSSGISHLQRTVGSATNGTYTGTFQVPRYSRPGTYFMTPTVEDERDGMFRGFGRDYGYFNPLGSALPAGATASITVVNNGPVDIMIPQWLTTDFEPQTVDVRAGPQAVQMRVRIRDGLSGFQWAFADLTSASSEYLGSVGLGEAAGPEAEAPISGDRNDGIWQTVLVVDRTSSSGPCTLSGQLADNAGNYGGLNDGGLGPIGPQNEILNVIGGGPANPAETAWSQTELGGFPWVVDTALNRDADHDGLPNVVEFHLGTDPEDATNAANPAALPVVAAAGTVLRMEFGQSAANQALGDGAVTQLVGQSSPNLNAWTTIIPAPIGGGRYRVEAPAVAGKIYLRLAVVPKP